MPCRLNSCQQGRAACPNPLACHSQPEPWERDEPTPKSRAGFIFAAIVALGAIALVVLSVPNLRELLQ